MKRNGVFFLQIGLAALLLVLFCPRPSLAQWEARWGIGFGGGVGFGVDEAKGRPLEPQGRIYVLWLNGLAPHLSLEAGAGYQKLASDDPDPWGTYSTTMIPFDLRLRWAPLPSESWQPYLTVGFGFSSFKVDKIPPGVDATAKTSGLAPYPVAGLGIYGQLSDNWGINLGFHGNPSFSDNLDPLLDDKNDGWWDGLFSLVYQFGSNRMLDSDGDGLTDYDEINVYHTDPNKADTDGDGLSDGDEVLKYHTDPLKADTDGDGLKDGAEVMTYHTDPLKADSDGDGLNDGDEILKYHTNPEEIDTDGDGLSDGDEVLKYHTDPLKVDTDGDGLSDGDEVMKYHTNPLNRDTDGGSVDDGTEVRRGTNPLDASDDIAKAPPPPAPAPKDEINLGTVGGGPIALEGIEFDVGKSTIRPSSDSSLQKALKTMQNHPDISVQINGYTDNSGARAKNIKLSADRAAAVKTWLVNHGIAATRMDTKGFGPDNPVAPNDTPANKQKNRRIEFIRTK